MPTALSSTTPVMTEEARKILFGQGARDLKQ
jgi:hypothetical protein